MAETQSNFYTIKQGDTLWKITGGDWNKINKICKANNISNANSIFAGAKLDLSCLNDSTERPKLGDDFVRQTEDKPGEAQEGNSQAHNYIKWTQQDENAQIPEFEAFNFDRNAIKDKPLEEQVKIYTDKMTELAKGIIDIIDEGDKDGKLNLNEYIKLATDGKYDEKSLKEAGDIIKKYDLVSEDGNKTPDGKIQREELAQYVKDKYGKDISQINSNEFDKYAKELTDLMTQSNLYKLHSENFSNIAKNDDDKDTISKEEYSALLTMHDIDWNKLKADNNKKVLDVVDGKLNFHATQTIIAEPSKQDYGKQVNYLQELFNALFKKK